MFIEIPNEISHIATINRALAARLPTSARPAPLPQFKV